jgi:hypothetical protein
MITFERHIPNAKKREVEEAVRRRVEDMITLLQIDLKKVTGIRPRETKLAITEEVIERVLEEIWA